MKTIILLYTFLIIGITAVSQEFSVADNSKLKSLSIQMNSLDLDNINIERDLYLINNVRSNKTKAIIFTSLAVITFALGVAIISAGNNALTDGFGGVFIVGGVIQAGISIPFWRASKKGKHKRNKLKIKLF